MDEQPNVRKERVGAVEAGFGSGGEPTPICARRGQRDGRGRRTSELPIG